MSGLEAIRAEKGAELRSLELDLDKAEGELELVEIRAQGVRDPPLSRAE